ncbi:hypothetical protein Tco_0654877 [Tanacetum coccineum]|uniref:Uncharacterized protein n=1 Tax=Tanacetum coccineum TaxID=301880 RepID=A0ABQ4X4W6_9ASTR
MPRYDINTLAKKFKETLKEVDPIMVNQITNQNMKDNLPQLVVEGIKLEREMTKADFSSMVADAIEKEQERTRAELSSQVSYDIASNVPLQVDAFLKNYMNNTILHVHPTLSISSSIPDLQHQLYLQMRDDEQAQHVDFAVWIALKYKYKKPSSHVEPYGVDAFRRQDHEDHYDDDARPEGEISAKKQRTSKKDYDPWSKDQGIDDDEVPSKEVTPDFLAESWILTSDDKKRMQDTLNDMMRSYCDSGEEHAYHLDQMKRYMENHIVWVSRTKELTKQVPVDPSLLYQGFDRNSNAPPRYLSNKDLFYLKYGNSEERKYVLSLHKIHAISFPDQDHKELKSRWVRKVIKRFKLEAHEKIVEVIKIQYDQCHGQEFIKEVIVRRADGTMSSFPELDYKYLNKNHSKDLYMMCLNGKIEHLRNELIKTLIIFIRSSVIWERVHDYQLGMESYQIKVNLTAPKLTFPGIEEKTPYSITTLLFVGLIYKNSKKEKRIMDIDEIPKFCDATLKRVLEKGKKINLDVKHGYAKPVLSDQDAKLMRFFETYIQDHLKHPDQMIQ